MRSKQKKNIKKNPKKIQLSSSARSFYNTFTRNKQINEKKS